MCVIWDALGRQHSGGIRHTRDYWGCWALWTRNGRRNKSRQGEPSTHDADRTNEKGERKTGLWVRRTSDCSAALRKFRAAQCEVLAQRLPVDKLCTGQQCPSPCILTVLRHWLGTAWENGLSSNVGIIKVPQLEDISSLNSFWELLCWRVIWEAHLHGCHTIRESFHEWNTIGRDVCQFWT